MRCGDFKSVATPGHRVCERETARRRLTLHRGTLIRHGVMLAPHDPLPGLGATARREATQWPGAGSEVGGTGKGRGVERAGLGLGQGPRGRDPREGTRRSHWGRAGSGRVGGTRGRAGEEPPGKGGEEPRGGTAREGLRGEVGLAGTGHARVCDFV